ncbi:hypothetical protein [Natrinema pallidum]|uniref:Uncharacterized protein n=1 Tax=Natrinema pallidum DSM 3751 TaxID=1227495 RepID=L9Z6V7_9EURY|nr:hypothetical protein [Natrinema pallidum]ELY82240.1 hypothetical protein C487_02408 [Natrinema pallidum DSM 3751]
MQATIDGERETEKGKTRFGIRIEDNQGVEHGIELGLNGEIHLHKQEGYPDKPLNRTPEENEHVSQARRYARYYVAQETEYDVLSWERDTASMNRVKTAIESLDEEAFERYFGTYFDQINSRLPEVKAPVSEPDAVDDEFVLYMLDVYLNESDQIEATSGIHFLYLDDEREKQVVLGEQPFPKRDPDARLQLKPNYLPSLAVAQEFFAYHLRCQIRDCYILRGEQPPEAYRVIGPGLYDAATRYLREQRPYLPYHKLNADISGYTLEFDYGLGEQGKEMVRIAGAVADEK